MPIYEYECEACNWRFEKKQRFHDDPVAECPRCQSKSKRVIAGAAVIFKGSGFYVTDYRKDGAKSTDTVDSKLKTEAKTEAKTESKSESKTEIKTENKDKA